MSRGLGQFILRYKYLIVIAWVIGAIWMATQAPLLSDVAISETSEFLPATAPSVQAQKAIAAAFAQEGDLGSAIVVFSRPGGLTDADNAYAKSFGEWLLSPDAPQIVRDVTSIFSQQGSESLLLSQDRSVMMMSVGFSTGPYENVSIAAIKAIRAHASSSGAPQDLDVHLTGTSAISGDQRTALFEGVGRTTIATILLVVIVLLLIYRSPVAAMAPLFTIGMAFLFARGLLGYLAAAGWMISSFVDSFIIVVIFGVGTDYCLFILSRFREELGRRDTREEAIVVTMSAIGAVITASASTVIVALMLMLTGRFVMMQTMGPAMALAVFVTLLAGLTLTPALVAIIGHYLFWPRHDEIQKEGGRSWQRLAEITSEHSRLVAVAVTLLLLIPYLAMPFLSQMFDVLSELPKKTDSVLGFDAISRGFDPGELLPVTVLLTAPDGDILANLSKIDQVGAALEAAPEVQRVRDILQPTGDEQTSSMFHVDTQLKQTADALTPLIKGLDDPQSMGQSSGSEQQGGMGDLSVFLTDLASVPGMSAKPAYTDAVARTKSVDAGLTNLNNMMLLTTQLESMSKQIAQMVQTIASATAATASSPTSAASDLKDLGTYLSQLGPAFPGLATEPSYQDTLPALTALGDDLTKAQESLLVSNQLGLVAQQMQTISQALSTPLGALALAGGTTNQQLTLLAGYYMDLAKAFPAVASTPASQSIMARLAKLDAVSKQGVPAGADMTAVLAGVKTEIDGLAADTLALRQTFATQNPTAQFIPQNLQALAGAQAGAATPDPATSARRLADDLAALTIAAKAQYPTATFTPKDIPLNTEVRQALAKLKDDAAGLQSSLNSLATGMAAGEPVYFLPRAALNDPQTGALLKYFLSDDGKSTRLTVVLKARPYSAQANADVRSLEPQIASAAKAAGLTAVMGGAPVIMNDIQQTLASDFIRIGIFTLIGVFIVLVLLLRSLVAPFYLVLTVLLSYGTTIGLSTLVFQGLLRQNGVNYIIPIVVFVLLVALGADYNIFLMSRVREEAQGRSTHEGIRIASAYTGGIITSCGVILAGTFAAMMVAPIQTLFQVGFAVAAGVLIDTFIIRAILVPAIASILGELNWWPGKIKTAK